MTAVTDSVIADLVADLYNQPSQFDRVINIDKVCIGIKETPDAYIAIGRGSYTLLDWLRDAFSALVTEDPDIGIVPLGFHTGIPETAAALTLPTNKSVYFGGHSLGAAHVCQLAGKAIARGLKIAGMTLFGCPNPGAEKLKYLLSGTSVTSYKNLTDPVTSLPTKLLVEPVVDFTSLSVTPQTGDALGIFAPHRFIYYHKGIQERIFNGKPAS
jgi:hypothetical protein